MRREGGLNSAHRAWQQNKKLKRKAATTKTGALQYEWRRNSEKMRRKEGQGRALKAEIRR